MDGNARNPRKQSEERMSNQLENEEKDRRYIKMKESFRRRFKEIESIDQDMNKEIQLNEKEQ